MATQPLPTSKFQSKILYFIEMSSTAPVSDIKLTACAILGFVISHENNERQTGVSLYMKKGLGNFSCYHITTKRKKVASINRPQIT